MFLLSLSVAGCAVKRDNYAIPEVELPVSYRHNSGEKSETESTPGQTAPMTVPQAVSKWWTHFGNDELNGLVEGALANNHQLKAAIGRIAESKAQWGAIKADQWPVLSTSAKEDITAPRDGKGDVKPGGKTISEKNYDLGLQISYEADFWGKNSAASEAAYNTAWSSVFAREVVALTLTSSMVQNFIKYLSFNDRIQTAKDTERVYKDMLQAVIDRLDDGEATSLQIAQQRTAVFAASAVIPVLELQREQARNSIALLMGKAPSEVNLQSDSLDDIVFPEVKPGLPSRLLLRRPDIRKAETELIAADASIDVARASLLPTFKLTGDYGYGSHHLSSLLSPESLYYNLAVSITQAIFDAGKRESQVDFAKARHEVLVQTYMETAYTALKEVEDALVSIRFLTLRKQAQEEAVVAGGNAFELSTTSYTVGTLDFLTLLDTERTMFREEDQLHLIKFERLQSAVDLFKALGGGMESDDAKMVAAADKGENRTTLDGKYATDEEPQSPEVNHVPSLPEKEGFWVQLAATWSESALERHWRLLKTRYPNVLENISPTFRREGVPAENEKWYTMLVGPFEQRNNADGLCVSLRNEGQGCHVLVR
ncbi:MAG: hypothetical protein A3G18_10650 [Rhodospirillales bacterium RIFCSPLOWO2_12_FULL_58_28]|nr:MAG: hypothetical protein A3H92_11010 [Rhodospirillales bacterium RIFCSPLOWO2_02_FULL_58_16]OHC77879.1 MAG: hypothetical protein A3G18_10650 [Rhodospirillales bacterium RIFCSPLOWO2_12_FULL_58_28]